MKNKLVLSLVLNLVALTPLAHADFLDLSGAIIWQSSGDDGKCFIEMFEEALSSGGYSSETSYNINLRLDQDNGSFGDYQGWTLLMMAAHVGCQSIVELLLEKGADFQMKSNNDKTALDIAQAAGHEQIVKLIAQQSQPKSLVEQMVHVVVDNLRRSENQEAVFADIMARVPVDLHEMIQSHMSKTK